MRPAIPTHRVVIAGGGAGGLELASRLGRSFGPNFVTLIDQQPFHIWKPSLHEVAAGTLDIHQEGLSYPMLANLNGFTFARGEIVQFDRHTRHVHLAAVSGPDDEVVLPRRQIPYDTLVVALGSLGNFFDTPGAEEHAIALDTTASAEAFRMSLLRALAQDDVERRQGRGSHALHLIIVGGGATGVELAAELNSAGALLADYVPTGFDPSQHIRITLVESGPRLLAALPERVAESACETLQRRGINVELNCRVTQVTNDAIEFADGRRLPCDLCIWAAGIRGPAVLETLDLPLSRSNQLIVNAFLQTPDPHVFALGDCAAAPSVKGPGEIVPARAQAAHQQARYLAHQLLARLHEAPLEAEPFVYRDRGSLVSLGTKSGVGSLMGGLISRGMFVSGLVARVMYASLHLMHHWVVLGPGRTFSVALGRLLLRRSQPRVKLH